MEKYEVMTARELFEELGYGYTKNDRRNWIECICRCGESDWKEIIFRLQRKEVRIVTSWNDECVDMPTLKAIYKQCEELGWLE